MKAITRNFEYFPLKLETFIYKLPFNGIMKLSKTEIQTLEQIAKGNKKVKDIAEALKKSKKQIYVILKSLKQKGFNEKSLHVTLFLQLLRIPNLHEVLSDSGILILSAMLEPSTIKEISKKTGLKKTVIYEKIKKSKNRSIVIKSGSKFKLNSKIWPNLILFLEELKKYEDMMDLRVPQSSVIYFKNNKEVVFSCKEEFNAEKTAFSVYGDYSIKLLTKTKYYYLPKKQLSKKDILLHSLYIEEKEHSIQNLIFIALFYAKHKIKIKHQILKNLDLIFQGEKIKDYPSYQEIKDKAEVYNIKI